MDIILKATACILIAVIITLILNRQGKEFSLLLVIFVCCTVTVMAFEYYQNIFILTDDGKLYGAVTTNVVADSLSKLGFEIERKKIELPGLAIKTVGTYKAIIKLYEAQTAEIQVVVKAQGDEAAEKKDN